MRQQQCIIPEECRLDLWAKVIIAKDVQCYEGILGSLTGTIPVPAPVVVTGLETDPVVEEILCLEDIKVESTGISTSFVCASQVNVVLDFTVYFWFRTNLGYFCYQYDIEDFTKAISVCDFVKADGSTLTPAEFRTEVDQAEVVIQNYQLAYFAVAGPPEEGSQTVNVVILADIITKLGKFKDVIVYGFADPTICPPVPIDPCLGANGTNNAG